EGCVKCHRHRDVSPSLVSNAAHSTPQSGGTFRTSSPAGCDAGVDESLSLPIELSVPQAEGTLGGSLERVRVTPVRIPIPSKTTEAMITHWVGAPTLIRPQATPAMTTRNPTT